MIIITITIKKCIYIYIYICLYIYVYTERERETMYNIIIVVNRYIVYSVCIYIYIYIYICLYLFIYIYIYMFLFSRNLLGTAAAWSSLRCRTSRHRFRTVIYKNNCFYSIVVVVYILQYICMLHNATQDNNYILIHIIVHTYYIYRTA